MSLRRQFSSFFLVGLSSTAFQYVVLIGLKELAAWSVVTASLTGYFAGGLLNYTLNRRHTFGSDRPHAEAGWRFVAVMTVGFLLTWAFMRLFVFFWNAPNPPPLAYMSAQVVTSLLVMVWNFVGHRLWTFRAEPTPPTEVIS
jgi:putative flippase GtrA